jgi:hypothetical protein
MKNAQTVAMSAIRAKYEELNPGGHWFDKDTMRFFKCQLPRTGYLIRGAHYFVTRETNPSDVTKYSVRQLTETGRMETIGEFHSYRFKEDATAAIQSIANQVTA